MAPPLGLAPDAADRLAVVQADGLVAHVAAGHHQGGKPLVHEQMVQRGVGQHHPQHPVARGHRGRHPAAGQGRGQHDGPLPAYERLLGGRLQVHQLLGRLQVRNHHRQGLLLAVLAGAQAGHGLLVQGVGRQVEPAQALDGHHLAAPERLGRRPHRVIAGNLAPSRVGQPEPGPAHRAGVGLGVEAAVTRVVVLPLAVGAHGEGGHGGQGPVVGHVLDDGVARAAVGAVDEGIAKAAVARVAHFGQAGLAHRGVRADQGPAGAGPGGANLEFALTRLLVRLPAADPGDPGQGGRLPFQPREKALHIAGRALHGQFHPGRGVGDVTGQVQGAGQIVDKGAEPHPLHHPAHLGPYTHARPRRFRTSPSFPARPPTGPRPGPCGRTGRISRCRGSAGGRCRGCGPGRSPRRAAGRSCSRSAPRPR